MGTKFTIEGGDFLVNDTPDGSQLFTVSSGGTALQNGPLTVKASSGGTNLISASATGVDLVVGVSNLFTVKTSAGGTAILGVTSTAMPILHGVVSATSIGGTGWNLRLCVTDGNGTVYFIPARSSTF